MQRELNEVSDDSGTDAHIEAQLDFLYGEGDSDDKISHRKRLINEDGTINGFQRKGLEAQVLRKREEDAAPPPAQTTPRSIPTLPPDLADDIPEPVEGYEDRVDVVGAIKDKCSIVTAVHRWGKPQPNLNIGNRTEGIMVRCPFPIHPDNDPSAWINTNKQVWKCGACDEGGDVIAFYAARKHELTQQQLRADKDKFRQVIGEMADELGIDTDPPAPPVPLPPPEPDDDDPDAVHVLPEPDIPAAPDNEAPSAPPDPILVALDPDDFDPRDTDPMVYAGLPEYDWLDLDLPQGTFLYDWMDGNTTDLYQVAPEYFIMAGFQGLGLCCGHHLQPVTHRGRSNSSLMLVLIGNTGCGKNFAKDRLIQMFSDVSESRFDETTATGIKCFSTPGSSEALLDALRYEMEDPTAVEKMIPLPVTGLLVENEFKQFVSKSNRKGNEAVKARVIDLYDFCKRRDGNTPELVTADRARMSGLRELYDSYFSATFLVQPQVLRSLVTDDDVYSGFMNRILPVYGRERRMDDTTVPANLDDPIYYETWRNTWKRIRSHPIGTAVPWDPDVGKYLMSNDTWLEAGILVTSKVDGAALLSRLKHQACRLAFLLAVNEGRMTVGVKHFEIALRFVRDYIRPCYTALYSAAKATESQDTKVQLLEYLHRFHHQHGLWPTRRDLGKQRFWNAVPDQIQKILLENLILNQKIGFIWVKEGSRRTATYIATDRNDHWGRHFSGCNGAIYGRTDVYGNA